MLLPALSKARERAKTTVCKNNMRQFGYCYISYVNDHDEYIPLNTPREWIYYMQDYLPNYSWGHKVELLTCPSVVAAMNPANAHKYSDICLNQYAAVNTNGARSKAAKFSQVSHPSTTLLGFEFKPHWATMGGDFYKLNSTYILDCYRHNSTMNVIYMDYHIGSYNKGKLQSKDWNKAPWCL